MNVEKYLMHIKMNQGIDNKKIIAELFKRLTINIEEGAVIPILHRATEVIEIHCHDGGVSDIKVRIRPKL